MLDSSVQSLDEAPSTSAKMIRLHFPYVQMIRVNAAVSDVLALEIFMSHISISLISVIVFSL